MGFLCVQACVSLSHVSYAFGGGGSLFSVCFVLFWFVRFLLSYLILLLVLDAYFLMRTRKKDMDLGERGSREDLGRGRGMEP